MKCLKQFKVHSDARVIDTGKYTLIGGVCRIQGTAHTKGHSIFMVGRPGDNATGYAFALGAPSREAAMATIKKTRYPVHKAIIILDYEEK